jgi:hypothetical protein
MRSSSWRLRWALKALTLPAVSRIRRRLFAVLGAVNSPGSVPNVNDG